MQVDKLPFHRPPLLQHEGQQPENGKPRTVERALHVIKHRTDYALC